MPIKLLHVLADEAPSPWLRSPREAEVTTMPAAAVLADREIAEVASSSG